MDDNQSAIENILASTLIEARQERVEQPLQCEVQSNIIRTDKITLDLDKSITPKQRTILNKLSAQAYQELPELSITAVHFTPMPQRLLEDMSKRGILINSSSVGRNIHELNDARMGNADTVYLCATCNNRTPACPGHPGVIKLNTYIANPIFKRYIIHALHIVCNSCSLPLFKDEELAQVEHLSGLDRLSALSSLCAGKDCLVGKGSRTKSDIPCSATATGEQINCGPGRKYDVSNSMNSAYFHYKEEKKAKTITQGEAYWILHVISDATAVKMGLSKMRHISYEYQVHPRDWFITYLVVVPPCLRPPVNIAGAHQQNPLTQLYAQIIKKNAMLSHRSETIARKPKKDIEKSNPVNDMINLINKLISVDKSNTKSTVETKSMAMYLDGKKGMWAKYLMGKKPNFVARTVAGLDAIMPIQYAAFPMSLRHRMTVPELCSIYNREYLNELLRDGEIVSYTPRHIKDKSIALAITDQEIQHLILEVGDIIRRKCRDGDIVLINRQPTLHRGSMFVVMIRLVDNDTFGASFLLTIPMGLDYDGDEMNIHMLQSLKAMAEGLVLLNPMYCIMDPKKSAPMIGAKFDSVLVPSILTLKHKDGSPFVKFTEKEFKMIYQYTKQDASYPLFRMRLNAHYVDPYSGYALISCIFPHNLYYKAKGILIEDGVLISGILTSDHVGPKGGSIVQALDQRYGARASSQMLNDVLRISYIVLKHFYASSIGVDDCLFPEKTAQEIDDHNQSLIESARRQIMNIDPTLTKQVKEEKISGIIDRLKAASDNKIIKSLDFRNALLLMQASGTKGSLANIVSVLGMKGQEYYKGQRMMVQGSQLPYFPSHVEDSYIEKGGFIDKNFSLNSMAPRELFFSAVGVRSALVAQAMETAKTGAIYKALLRFLEDIRVLYDGTVRSRGGSLEGSKGGPIIMPIYANDGFDPAKLTMVSYGNANILTFVDPIALAGMINKEYGVTKAQIL